ncbi:MAG: hypothetical protein JKY95_11385 [Planctomycetaceae bacterium]|nr:hypothetical protein [Planctomycetaceae bacterium]
MSRFIEPGSREQSLFYRIDFRWLAQGFSIDHTTLSEFRRKDGIILTSDVLTRRKKNRKLRIQRFAMR